MVPYWIYRCKTHLATRSGGPSLKMISQLFLQRVVSTCVFGHLFTVLVVPWAIAGLSCRVCRKAARVCGMRVSNECGKDSGRSLWSQSHCFLENKEGNSSNGDFSDPLGDTEYSTWYPTLTKDTSCKQAHVAVSTTCGSQRCFPTVSHGQLGNGK